MKPTTIALITPFDYQPFHSIRQLCSVLTAQLQILGAEVISVTPSGPLGSITKTVPSIHRGLAAWERLTYSPAMLRLKLQALERKAKQLKREFVVLLSDQSLGVMAGSLSGFHVIGFVSDLIAPRAAFGDFGQPSTFGRRFVQQANLTGLKNCNAFLCPSRSTANDLARILPGTAERIFTAPLPLPSSFAPVEPDDLDSRQAQLWRQKNLLPQAYFLHVGSGAWYKNRPSLIHLIAELKKLTPTPPALVFAGAPPTSDELALASQLNIIIHSFTQLSTADLNTLYNGAEALLMPSTAEGFGWPALEALACGTPLVITDTPALSENFSTAAALIFPTADSANLAPWAAEMAPSLLQLLQLSADDRQSIIEQGITHARENFTEKNFRETLQKAIESLT